MQAHGKKKIETGHVLLVERNLRNIENSVYTMFHVYTMKIKNESFQQNIIFFFPVFESR